MGQQAFNPDNIQFESNIPIPSGHPSSRKWLAVLLRMKVGDSFKIAREHAHAIRSSALSTRSRERKTYEIEKVWVRIVDLKNGEIRVWRVAEPDENP